MNFANKISGMILTGIMCFSAVSTLNFDNVFGAENTWQESYLEVIDENIEAGTENYSYSLAYIDDDEIPELLIYTNNNYYSLYTFYNSQADLCEKWTYRSTTKFCTDKSGYCWITVNENGYVHYSTFYRLESGSFNRLYVFCTDQSEFVNGNDSDETPTVKYSINDEYVNEEEYQLKMAELEQYSDFAVQGTSEYSYDGIRQYLLDSMKNEIPQVEETTQTTDDNVYEDTTTTAVSSTVAVSDETTQSASNTTASSTNSTSVSTSTVSTTSEKTSSPKTGDKGMYAWIIGCFALITACLSKNKKKSS
ncbi:MAG: hypothetical protein K2J47_04650 [Ruminococcus sp.]|nr:hypothetical protein [Ruminococcus sp.]